MFTIRRSRYMLPWLLLAFLAWGTANFTTAALLQAKSQSRALTRADFTMVAAPGFGDRGNTWAWTSGYINNHIVVGTGRWEGCATIYSSNGTPPPEYQCPPKNRMAAAQRAQIWSADASVAHPLTQADWHMQYKAPLVNGIPVNHAFRGASVFTDNNNRTLFLSGVGFGIPDLPPSLLSSTDGTTFTDIPQDPGTTMGDINTLTTTAARHPLGMRGSVQFKDSFIVPITGASGSGSLFASKTPLLGDNTFQQMTPQSMFVWEIANYNNHLYISLANPQGYGVVRTDCTMPDLGMNGCPASAFTTVIPFGAGLARNLNGNVESMTVYTDPAGAQHLYVGGGVEPPGNIHGAELTRINPDDSWDLIVGTPRTVNGVVKNPLSGLGEGFNSSDNKYMWSMDSYNGALFVGTWNTGNTGCQLWSSADGVAFQPITTDGFGNPQCAGIRTTRGTPYGVFVGTVDDYGSLQVWEGK